MASWKTNNPGLSLLGTLLAVFLLGSVAIAVSQLVVRTERSTQTSREVLTATVLGREGIELARALRDTNWFLRESDGRHWTQGLCDSTEFTLDPLTVRRLNPVGGKDKAPLFIAGNGEWVHEPTSQPTAFQRLLSVDCGEKDISFLVTAKVNWQGADQKNHEWVLREKLYDWAL